MPVPDDALSGASTQRAGLTALNPPLGYEQAAAVAQEALATGRTLRQVVRGRKLMDAATLDRALDSRRMTNP